MCDVLLFCLAFAGGSGKVHSSADGNTELSQRKILHVLHINMITCFEKIMKEFSG